MAVAARSEQPAETPVVEADGVVDDAVAGAGEAPVMLGVRVEPAGPSAERAVALACAGTPLARDADAPLGRPAAVGEVAGGEATLAELVRASALALDETDLHLTIRRR